MASLCFLCEEGEEHWIGFVSVVSTYLSPATETIGLYMSKGHAFIEWKRLWTVLC